MSKVIELRKIIQSFLRTKHPRVYFEAAKDDALYPYVVYALPNSMDDLSMERFILEVDGWDMPANGDTTALETLMSIVDAELHRKTVMVNGISATLYRENRLSLTDDDQRIRRRKYIYQIRTHQAGG